tara:strand:- start:2627 stop:3073 length:447 start_codon:yes stop_codon:yes gene_type:complete
MKSLHEKILKNEYNSFENKRFRTIAQGRNIIEKTTEYTSNMRDKEKTYMGRGSKAGFIDKNEIYNQFIDLAKDDGKWSNVFIDDKFIETWKDISKKEEISKWKEGKKGLIIRLFVKTPEAPYYLGYGIYYYVGTSANGVLWKKMNYFA